MTSGFLSLERLRQAFSALWILVVFGAVYAVSQLVILVVINPIGAASFLQLQCLGLHASDYLTTFNQWQTAGIMPFYQAHFRLDDTHWIWYTIFFTAALARVFEINSVSSKFNFMLTLPLISGLLDWFENTMQHIFLESPDYSAIVDPLPLISSLSSDLKWLLVAVYVTVVIILTIQPVLSKKKA